MAPGRNLGIAHRSRAKFELGYVWGAKKRIANSRVCVLDRGPGAGAAGAVVLPNGETKYVNPARISKITDSSGKDCTRAVLDGGKRLGAD